MKLEGQKCNGTGEGREALHGRVEEGGRGSGAGGSGGIEDWWRRYWGGKGGRGVEGRTVAGWCSEVARVVAVVWFTITNAETWLLKGRFRANGHDLWGEKCCLH